MLNRQKLILKNYLRLITSYLFKKYTTFDNNKKTPPTRFAEFFALSFSHRQHKRREYTTTDATAWIYNNPDPIQKTILASGLEACFKKIYQNANN